MIEKEKTICEFCGEEHLCVYLALTNGNLAAICKNCLEGKIIEEF